MTRTKPSGQRRSDLLDAAEAAVLRDGIDSVTVDDVTTGAGVAKGTFYLHFGSKDDLITALRDRYVQRFVDAQRASASAASAASDPDGGDGADRVERWVLSGIREYLADTRLHDVLFRHGPPADRHAEQHRNLAADALRDLLVEVEAGVPDPYATAVILYHAMHGAADHILHYPADEDRILAEVSRTCRTLLT